MLFRSHVFCDDWEQASHGGELVHAVEAGRLERSQVTELGAVLAGRAPGRASDEEITVFPDNDLSLEIEASEKKGKAKIEIAIAWKHGGRDAEDDE